MVEINNIEVFNLEKSVVASGNAMRLEIEDVTKESFDKGLERCKKLSKLGGGTGQTNFRTGILVSFDLKYPQYFSKQIQRYHFFQYVSSTSLMHRITKMDFYECCNKYVSLHTIAHITDIKGMYNDLSVAEYASENWYNAFNSYKWFVEYNYKSGSFELTEKSPKEEVLYDCYMRLVSNCPMGAELTVHATTNYEQLATIYKQRKNHKLKEDWGEFCNFIESLPYAKDLIICE